MKTHEAISDALGVEYKPEVLPVKVEPAPVVVNDNNETPQDQAEDYRLSRSTFRNLIKKGEEAIDELYDLAKNSEHPRSYEVLATLMKTVSDTTKDLYDLQKKTKDLKQPDKSRPQDDTRMNIEKAVFVGSPSDLLKKIKNNEDV